MKPRYLYLSALLVITLLSPVFSTGIDDLQTKKLTVDRMKYFPVTPDNKNYIFLQSIESDTAIIIGDFSGVEKKIIMIVDKKSDNTIDTVFEYYPQTKDLKQKSESQSKFFNKDIAKLKKDIIEGSVYRGNFTDSMKSLNTLESILKNPDTRSLYSDVYGFSIKYYEVDELKKNSALFQYGKAAAGYYLQFKTEYSRKDHTTVQKPVLNYSVFCRDSNDSVVKDTVENLFKIRKPGVSSAKGTNFSD